MTKYRMGEITAQEMREILPTRPVVLLPLGSFEDQGPHAPMGDYLSAERMADTLRRRLKIDESQIDVVDEPPPHDR